MTCAHYVGFTDTYTTYTHVVYVSLGSKTHIPQMIQKINPSAFVPLEKSLTQRPSWSGYETCFPSPCLETCNKILALLQTPTLRVCFVSVFLRVGFFPTWALLPWWQRWLPVTPASHFADSASQAESTLLQKSCDCSHWLGLSHKPIPEPIRVTDLPDLDHVPSPAHSG